MNLNQVTITGNVGKTPHVTEKNNEAIAYMDICHQVAEGRSEWHKVVAFGDLAKKLRQIEKGALVIVSGSLSSYESQKNEEGKWMPPIVQIRARQILLGEMLKKPATNEPEVAVPDFSEHKL